jgi:hypothetical protein
MQDYLVKFGEKIEIEESGERISLTVNRYPIIIPSAGSVNLRLDLYYPRGGGKTLFFDVYGLDPDSKKAIWHNVLAKTKEGYTVIDFLMRSSHLILRDGRFEVDVTDNLTIMPRIFAQETEFTSTIVNAHGHLTAVRRKSMVYFFKGVPLLYFDNQKVLTVRDNSVLSVSKDEFVSICKRNYLARQDTRIDNIFLVSKPTVDRSGVPSRATEIMLSQISNYQNQLRI